MGLIRKLKELFNKNIECGNEINDHIVFPITKKKWIYLNKNIYVKENTNAVIVYKYRVCDIIYPGKYKFNQSSIPETFGRAKIEKLNKKGAKARRIKADIYFVNLNEFSNFLYESDIPFRVKSGPLGRVKGYLEGSCKVKVIDAGALIRALITDTGKAKLKEIHNDIGLWIGNKINHIIDKNKISATEVLSHQEYVESIVNTEIQDSLDKIGIFVSNVKLKAVNFPKRYQNKVNAYMSTHQRQVKNFDINTSFGSTSCDVAKVPVSSVPRVENSNTMQNVQKINNVHDFKVCSICKKHNSIDAKICIGCGNKL